MNQARDIGAVDSAQVLISSHSASILSRIEPDEVRYFRIKTDSVSLMYFASPSRIETRNIASAISAWPSRMRSAGNLSVDAEVIRP